jgi:hypothetical protein
MQDTIIQKNHFTLDGQNTGYFQELSNYIINTSTKAQFINSYTMKLPTKFEFIYNEQTSINLAFD